MNHSKLKGFLYGLATSVTFGLIPLFTLPLMGKGLTSDTILFYRFIAATLALGLMMVIKKECLCLLTGIFYLSLKPEPNILILRLNNYRGTWVY